MNCLQELLPCRCRCRRHAGVVECGNEENKPPLPSPSAAAPLRFTRTRRPRRNVSNNGSATSTSGTATDNSGSLIKAFFESCMETTDDSTLRLLEQEEQQQQQQQQSAIKVKLGNIRKKEISKQGAPCPQKRFAYMSNHVVVNQERKQRDIPLLTRCAILDEMAKGKAQEMANQGHVLQPYHSATMVENVHRTPSLQLMHQLIMHGFDDNNTDRQHILDPRFVRFGMGTARGEDGMIYVSQLFQGSPKKHSPNNQNNTQGTNNNNPISNNISVRSAATTNTDTATTKSTEEELPTIKNPRTRVVPTLEIAIDPAILQNKKNNGGNNHNNNNDKRTKGNTKRQKKQVEGDDEASHNKASHQRCIEYSTY